jgi:oxygen-independent coproporphyrinogen-3 oxidase
MMTRYLSSLLSSLDAGLERYQPSGISTIFIGGGTPSLLPRESFSKFLQELERRTGPAAEFTIEANPESLDDSFLDVLSNSSVNRISMGVQTYDEKLLKWLGRPSGFEALDRADELLIRRWKGRINRDLLAALPRKPGGLKQDISQAVKRGSDHISLYELTVEHGTPLAEDEQSLKELPDEPVSLREWKDAVSQLKSAGFERYEVSNFAEKGMESKHNLGYWSMSPSLGIGPGAASTVPDGRGWASRIEEPGDLALWLRNPLTSSVETPLTTVELALEYFMMGLRTSKGISADDFMSVFGMNPANAARRSLDKWSEEGALYVENSSIRPSEMGMELLDRILVDIAEDLDGISWQSRGKWPPS